MAVALEQTVSEESALFVVESFELTWVHQETFEVKVHKLEILVERLGILNDRLVELWVLFEEGLQGPRLDNGPHVDNLPNV